VTSVRGECARGWRVGRQDSGHVEDLRPRGPRAPGGPQDDDRQELPEARGLRHGAARPGRSTGHRHTFGRDTTMGTAFVADDPPPALVDRLAITYAQRRAGSRGISETAASPTRGTRSATTRSEEFVYRPGAVAAPENAQVRQGRRRGENRCGSSPLARHTAAPRPPGRSDPPTTARGLSAVWSAFEWSTHANRSQRVSARTVRAQMGTLVRPTRAHQLRVARDGTQALALLLLAPDSSGRESPPRSSL